MALGDGLSLLFRIKADADQARREFSSLSTTVSKELRQIDTAGKSTTSTLGGLGSGISSIISPANLLAGAGIAAGAAIFALGKQALDAAGQLYDLSQKTNFSVETLSALKNAGETSGASIQSLSAALGIFDKNIVAAASGNDKLEATFKRLKISTTDNEQALRDAFRALMDMEGGAGQTAAAMELFGRSGKDVLAVIKETNGDLDVAIAKYREMGSLISTETATAADELGDSLTALGQGAKGAAADLMTSLAPAIKAIIFLVQQGINAIRGWIIVIKSMANVHPIIGQAQEMAANEASAKAQEGMRGGLAGRIPGLGIAGPPRAATPSSFGRIPGGGLLQTIDRNASWDISGGGVIPGGGSGGGAGGGGGRGADVALSAAIRDFRAVERENQQAMKEALREFEANKKEIEKSAVAHLKALSEIAAVYSRARIVQLRDDAQEGKITYLEAETAITAIIAGEFNKRAQELQKSIAAEKEGTEEYQRLTDEYGRLQAEAATFKEEAERRKRDALRQTIELEDIATTKAEMRARGGGEQEDVPGDVVGEGVEKTVDYSGKKKVPDFTEHINAIQTYKDAATSAWSAISQGFGDMVYGFLMGEKMSGKAFMAMAKSAIAAVAAQAAVQALFELGMGLASLWWNPPKAALHFAAAKTFALVAAVAGVASLAIPGGGGATASAAGGNQTTGSPGGSTKQGEPTPIDRNRTAGEIRVSVNVTRDSGSIVNAVVEDFRRNGRTRQVIGNDGQLATA